MGLDKMSTYAFKLVGRVQDGDLYGAWKFLRGPSCFRDIATAAFADIASGVYAAYTHTKSLQSCRLFFDLHQLAVNMLCGIQLGDRFLLCNASD